MHFTKKTVAEKRSNLINKLKSKNIDVWDLSGKKYLDMIQIQRS